MELVDAGYRQHTAVTDPGPHAALLRRLPVDIADIVPVLGHVLVHHSRVAGFTAGAGRPDDGTELRPVRKIIDAVMALDDRPWSRQRPEGRRLVVDCRSVAVLLAAALRERGVPARVRFGFASYLAPSHWQSHVICEHATAAGWTRTDPDVGRFALTGEAFLDATQAWTAEEPQQFGYGPAPGLQGRWTVRWELVRDLAALTGFEPMTSDAWGVVQQGGSGKPGIFDRIAAAGSYAERLALAGDPEVAVPRVIAAHPYLTGRSYEVDLVADGSLRDGRRA